MADTVNKRVGDYELLDHIGDGAQGKIFKARCVVDTNENVAKDEEVALKIVRRFGEDGRSEDRFRREVKNFLSISHPNLVDYREAFAVEDEWGEHVNCLVMEFLDGEDMKERLKRHTNGLPWEFVKDVFQQCLAGLAYASENGIIHRDLKPSNVFLLKNGGVKIIDFGIAKKEDGTVTTTSGFKGTYDYMAPDFLTTGEDFRGDEASDVFSMGVCFYQALTGRLPYTSSRESGWVAYLNRWQKGQARDISISAGSLRVLSDRAVSFVRKCLRVNREERYTSFQEMLADLVKIERRTVESGRDRYVFEAYMGKGGFGEVFKAKRLQDGKFFAVKHLFPSLDPSRFRREARLLQKYPHANIVGYEAYVKIDRLDGADHYLVMEFLQGMPGWGLRGRIKKDGALGVEEVLHLFCSYLNALEFLHTARGKPILHRDITPANLYAPPYSSERPEECVPKIFDMGIARSEQTQTGGHVPGNPEYMAPEFVLDPEFRGSPQSDIYCLGVCLFESLTGKCAYPRLSKQTAEMWRSLRERAEGKHSVSFNNDVFRSYPALETIVRKSMSRDWRKRYKSAAEMRRALETVGTAGGLLEARTRDDEEEEHESGTIFVPDEAYLAAAASGRKARALIRLKRIAVGVAALLVIAGLALGGWTLWEKREHLLAKSSGDDAGRADAATGSRKDDGVPPPPPPLPEFQATAAYVSLLCSRLTRAEELKERAPNDPKMIDAVGGFVRQWLTMPGRFDRAFTQALDAGRLDEAQETLEQWQKIAGVLPFKDLTAVAHGRQALSMERRLAFVKEMAAVRKMPPAMSDAYAGKLQSYAASARDSRATETQPQIRSWWLKQEEDLGKLGAGLANVFRRDFAKAMEARDLAAAEKLTADWKELLGGEWMSQTVPRTVRERVDADISRGVSDLFAYQNGKLAAACAKGDYAEAKGLVKWLSAAANAAPELIRASAPAHSKAIKAAATEQAACVRKLVEAISPNTTDKEFAALADLMTEWRGNWSTSESSALTRSAKDKCRIVTESSVKLAAAMYGNNEFAKGDDEYARLQKFAKAVPATFRPATLDDGLKQVADARERSTRHAEEFRLASAGFEELSAAAMKPDPATWRKQFAKWSALKVSDKVRESIMRSAKWKEFGEGFMKSVSDYVAKSQDSGCVKEVRSVLAMEAAEAALDKAKLGQLSSMLKLKERVFLDRAKLDGITKSMESGKPDTWRDAVKDLAASRSMPSLIYDKATWDMWKKAEEICFGHVRRHIEETDPAATREKRLVEAQDILRTARTAGTFDAKMVAELETLATREIAKIDDARREQARIEAARKEAEEKNRLAALEAERLERERIAAERRAAEEEKERLAELTAARLERERLEAALKAAEEEKKRLAALAAAQLEKERLAAAKLRQDEEIKRRQAELEAARKKQELERRERERIARLEASSKPRVGTVVPPYKTKPDNTGTAREDALSVVAQPRFDPILQDYLDPIETHLRRDEVREAVKMLTRELIDRCRKAERKKRGAVDWIRVSEWLRDKRERYPGMNVVGKNDLDLLEVELERYIARQRRGRR